VVVNEGAHVDQRAPVGKRVAYALVCPLNFAVGKLDVELIAVCTGVDVVKPTTSSPKELGTDCVALTTRVDDCLTVRNFLLPSCWLF